MRRDSGCLVATILLAAAAMAGCTGADDEPRDSRRATTPTATSSDASSAAPEAEVAPTGLEDMEQGEKPGLPYVEGATIHTSNGDIASPLKQPAVRVSDSGVSLVLGFSKNGRRDSVYQIVDTAGGSLRLVTGDSQGGAVISADGRFVAWVTESVDGFARVAGWDLERRKPLAHTATFPFKPTCCDNPLSLNAIDDRGRVYATGGGVAWLAPVRQRAEPQVIKGLRRTFIQSVATNGTILATGNGHFADVGRLGPDNVFTKMSRIGSPVGSFSADGRSLAYVDRYENLKIRDLTTGDVHSVQPPPGGFFGSVAWEDASNVLVETQATALGRRSAWVRCSVDDVPCEIAVALRRGLSFPF